MSSVLPKDPGNDVSVSAVVQVLAMEKHRERPQGSVGEIRRSEPTGWPIRRRPDCPYPSSTEARLHERISQGVFDCQPEKLGWHGRLRYHHTPDSGRCRVGET